MQVTKAPGNSIQAPSIGSVSITEEKQCPRATNCLLKLTKRRGKAGNPRRTNSLNYLRCHPCWGKLNLWEDPIWMLLTQRHHIQSRERHCSFHFTSISWDWRESAMGPVCCWKVGWGEGLELEKSKTPLCILKFKDDPRAKDETKTDNIPGTPRPSLAFYSFTRQTSV